MILALNFETFCICRLNNKTISAAFKGVDSSNHKLTEFFPVRRSVRKTKTIVQEEKQKTLELILRNDIEEGLKVGFVTTVFELESFLFVAGNCFRRKRTGCDCRPVVRKRRFRRGI